MKFLLFTALLIGGLNTAYAELQFPTTEAEIVQALTPKPIRQRKSLGGGKGIRAIRDDNPKIGALIQFDFDSADIKPTSYTLLREFAHALQRALSHAKIEIVGHTDNSGTEHYNLGLSKRRAQAIKAFLVSAYNIAENRLTIKFYGESQPLESNETEEKRAINRRVEFIRVDN